MPHTQHYKLSQQHLGFCSAEANKPLCGISLVHKMEFDYICIFMIIFTYICLWYILRNEVWEMAAAALNFLNHALALTNSCHPKSHGLRIAESHLSPCLFNIYLSLVNTAGC